MHLERGTQSDSIVESRMEQDPGPPARRGVGQDFCLDLLNMHSTQSGRLIWYWFEGLLGT